MADLQQGLVLAHLGQGIAVEVEDQILLCQTLRKLDTVVVGDRVLISTSSADLGRIEQILPRRSQLNRPCRGDKTRPVAANIDTIFVVFAVEPSCDFLLLDQYLAICENSNIAASLVLNKIDLAYSEVAPEPSSPATLAPMPQRLHPCAATIEDELQNYMQLGYSLHRVSAKKDIGMQPLKQVLSRQTSLFAGQSGVGKSSLTNTLLPDKNLKINSVSATTRHGRHTTTAATLYHLPGGGDLIDSPGVAIFGLAGLSEAQLAWGYREFHPHIGQCRFKDCKHVNDKDCAVRHAADTGVIPLSRYHRFLKLREKMPPANRG